nr:mercuric reductase-like [Nerophis lumbriciformis]
MQPWDEHNKKLISHVHPHDWVNPTPQDRYHLVVVGGGTAGLISSIVAAGAGAKVALVERHLLGGDCLNVGCVPSKGVISAARAWHTTKTAAEVFGAPPADGAGDFGQAMERMRRERAAIGPHDSAQRFSDQGIDVFLGPGKFVASDALEVDGQRLHFRRAVIATGARAAAPPIPGLAEVDYLTNESVFSLTELPPRFGVIGGGPIGCEIAQSFANFGSAVKLFDMAPHVLPREDADAAEIVQQALIRDGIDLRLGVSIKAIEKDGDAIVVVAEKDGETSRTPVDQLLVAVGRRPNTDGLGLEAAGVDYDKHGVTVNDNLRTSNAKIFACGDIASQYKFTHTADAQAKIVVQNALFFRSLKASSLVVPWATYTSPEIAHVGMYAEDAKKAGVEIDTYTVPLTDNDRAKLDGEADGFLRVHLKKGSDQIVGGTLVATHAGDLLAPLALAVTHKIGLGNFASTILPYPTQAEIYKRVASEWQKTKLTPTVTKILNLWMKIFK